MKKAGEILSGLNLDEKIKIITNAFDVFGEAAHGVQARHDQAFDLGIPAHTTVFQNPVGFSSTWDKELMHEIGDLVGTEARSLFNEKKHNAVCMFAPTIDMERDPRWGRNEEAYGEDPHLASRLAGEYILGMAGDDPKFVRTGAILKHFYGNNVEHNRSLCDSNISEELKDSYYIHVFEEVIDYADPLGVMSSYNYVNGTPNTFNPEIKSRLKSRGLPFVTGDGAVIGLSIKLQKAAETMPEALTRAIKAGLDCFLDDANEVAAGIKEALASGILTEAELDEVVVNRLLAYSMLGILEDKPVFTKEDYNLSKVDTENGRKLARRAGTEAIVLLKNENNTLPLADNEKVMLLGPFSDRCPLDWYSGLTSRQVTLAEGLGDHVHGTESLFPYVYIRLGSDYAGLNGVSVVPTDKANAELFRIMLWDDSRITLRSVSTGMLLTTSNPDVPDNAEEKYPLYAIKKEAFSWFVQEAFQFTDAAGEVIHFTEENVLHFWEDSRIAGIKNHDKSIALGFETATSAEEILEKLDDNAKGMTAIASFGLHPIVNCKEEIDRNSVELPPFQRALLRMIREKFAKVVLVLHTNAPLGIAEEHASDKIGAILFSATGNEEYGNCLADVLYGKESPAGRLSQTWYRNDAQLPDINDYDIKKNKTTYLYMEEDPLYRFGYGLSYTDFTKEITELKIVSAEPGRDAQHVAAEVTVRVKNTGARTSDFVVQVYAKKEGGYRLYEDVSEPGTRLAAFTRLKGIKPGEERIIKLACRY